MATFNKCIDDKRESLMPGTPILYQQGGRVRIAVIRERIEGPGGLHYQVSPEGRKGDLNQIKPEEVIATHQTEEEMAGLAEEGKAKLAGFKANPMIILGGVLTLLVLVVAIVYWRKKANSFWRYFWAGTLVWNLMIVVKTVMDITITQKVAAFGLLASFFYFGGRTGLLENGMTYAWASKKLKDTDFNQAVAYGIAFGGMEILMVGLLTTTFASVLTFKPEFLAFLPAYLRQEAITAYSASSWFLFAPVIERISALFIHLASCVAVFLSLRTKKMGYFWLAVALKGVTDGMVPLLVAKLPQGNFLLWAYLVEIPIAFLGLVSFLTVKWLKKNYPAPTVLAS